MVMIVLRSVEATIGRAFLFIVLLFVFLYNIKRAMLKTIQNTVKLVKS
jgi:hypothetical protein